ncbi:MAG TPA: hypothetical protein VF530_03735 [Planctomycetota bacterium]
MSLAPGMDGHDSGARSTAERFLEGKLTRDEALDGIVAGLAPAAK